MSDTPPPAAAPASRRRRAWLWIPSLYFAEGIPYVVVMTVSVIMYKDLKISNTEIALYTSLLYLPWVIKPFWSPLVDVLRSKRWWIVSMQLLLGAGLAGVALALPTANFFRYSLAFLWLLAFSSATHDIAADGFYMLALPASDQAWFVGIRSTFYRLAMITGQGLLVILAGVFEQSQGVSGSWATIFYLLAGFFLMAAAYHAFLLPMPKSDHQKAHLSVVQVVREFLETVVTFFQKPQIALVLCFLLFYRFSESQLVKMAAPFLKDASEQGGLGLTNQQFGVAYGTVGVAMLTAGGVIGGIVAANRGLRYWLWWMVAAMNLPNLVYVLLSQTMPDNMLVVNLAIAIEQFGYGFGFTAYMLFMLYVSRGEHETAHYAICTGFMALGMMLPGMASGWIQDQVGYRLFFLWVMLATIPSFLVCGLVKIDPSFGRRQDAGPVKESAP